MGYSKEVRQQALDAFTKMLDEDLHVLVIAASREQQPVVVTTMNVREARRVFSFVGDHIDTYFSNTHYPPEVLGAVLDANKDKGD